MFLIVEDCRVLAIIDGGKNNNFVSSDLVKNLGLTIHAHQYPYHLQWFNNSGKAKVTQTARVHFLIGSYHDYADFDIVSMQVSRGRCRGKHRCSSSVTQWVSGGLGGLKNTR